MNGYATNTRERFVKYDPLYFILSTLLVTSILSGPSLAQTSNDSTACIGILDRVNYNNVRNLSSTQQYDLNIAYLCSAEYEKANSGQRTNIEAGFKALTGSFGQSSSSYTEKQKEMCSGHFGEYWFQRSNLTEQRIAVSEALDTVAKCVSIAQQKKLIISTTISQDNSQIDFVLRWKEGGSLKLKYAGPQPWNAMKCYVNGVVVDKPSDLSTTLAPVTDWVFSCKREMKARTVGGEIVNCFSPFNVVINTDKISDSIPVPGYCDRDYLLNRAAQVDAMVSELSKKISDVQLDQKDTRSQLSSVQVGLGIEQAALRYTFVRYGAECPAGFHRVGMWGVLTFKNWPGGDFGGDGGGFNPDFKWGHPWVCERN